MKDETESISITEHVGLKSKMNSEKKKTILKIKSKRN